MHDSLKTTLGGKRILGFQIIYGPYWLLLTVLGLLPSIQSVRWWRRRERARGFPVIVRTARRQ